MRQCSVRERERSSLMFSIQIDLNSECFDELPSIELARVLNTLARMIDDEFLCGENREKEIVDFHGNHIGVMRVLS